MAMSLWPRFLDHPVCKRTLSEKTEVVDNWFAVGQDNRHPLLDRLDNRTAASPNC